MSAKRREVTRPKRRATARRRRQNAWAFILARVRRTGCISSKNEGNGGRILTDYLEVKFGIDEGEMVCEAGNIVGEPSYNYATHK